MSSGHACVSLESELADCIVVSAGGSFVAAVLVTAAPLSPVDGAAVAVAVAAEIGAAVAEIRVTTKSGRSAFCRCNSADGYADDGCHHVVEQLEYHYR